MLSCNRDCSFASSTAPTGSAVWSPTSSRDAPRCAPAGPIWSSPVRPPDGFGIFAGHLGIRSSTSSRLPGAIRVESRGYGLPNRRHRRGRDRSSTRRCSCDVTTANGRRPHPLRRHAVVDLDDRTRLSTGYCTEVTLFRTAERINTPGRAWVRKFLRVLASRSPGAAAESEGELRVVRALTRLGVQGLIRQHAIALPGYGPARFDMAIPPIRWALEVDLHPEHRTPDGIARDNGRDSAATSIGWLVRRVGEVELDRRFFDPTMRGIVSEIDERRRHVDSLIRGRHLALR